MVVFTCNTCGDSVKKNKVEQHILRCRQCQCLSCMDCGKDFWGDDYKKHNTCVTEEEKYSGKNYQPKSSANKGKKKQEMWIQVVKNTVSVEKLTPALKVILEKLITFENIPRTQNKFENFLRNCLHIKNPNQISGVWQIISNAFATGTEMKATLNNVPQTTDNQPSQSKGGHTDISETEVKISKRQRKEERKQKSKVEKKDKNLHQDNNPVGDVDDNSKAQLHETITNENVKLKKHKKRHKHPTNDLQGLTNETNSEPPEDACGSNVTETKKKYKKRRLSETFGNNFEETASVDEPVTKRQKGQEDVLTKKSEKFQWGPVIKAILEKAEDKELSIKKIKKKVVSEYMSRFQDKPTTKEAIEAKLIKKIERNPIFRLHKERVKLIQD